jgi:hypothetical protein
MIKPFFFTVTDSSCQRIIERTEKTFLLAELKRMLHRLIFRVKNFYDVVSEYGDMVFDFQFGKKKFTGFGFTHNWVKRSIF